jgi:DNA mismatch repair ATPase MutS
VPAPPSQRRWRARGLYDPGLALALDRPVVANDLDGDGKDLVMITGANQGGKSTFLRGLGAAQLMLQCGMFVAAQSFDAGLCEGIFTHFKREEDPSMRHGKFEEEVQRVSAIVDRLTPGSMVLFNESFQSTNEREGSEIARQIVEALRESGVRMAFVTHLYELAASFANAQQQNAAFLRAERLADGRRTFRLVPGAPQSTSYGHDVFAAVFGDAALHRGTDVEVAGSGAPMAERAVAMQKES